MGNLSRRNQMKADGNSFPEFILGWTIGANGGLIFGVLAFKTSVEETILKYINTFLGYGNPKSPFWFIGMEEGGGNDSGQVEHRFKVWNQRGQNATEDLVEFQKEIGITKWFVPPKPRLQATWKKLIRIYLSANGREAVPDVEAIRDFQVNRLGRRQISPKSPSPCLFELMPLPSPGLDECPCYWLAEQYPGLTFLNDRDDYTEKIRAKRIELLRQHIRRYQPAVVCFYGMDYFTLSGKRLPISP
jgi:hypothetical protein